MCSNSSVIPHFLILSHVHTNLSIIPSGKAVTSGDVVCPFQISRRICCIESVIHGLTVTFTKSPRINGDSATPLMIREKHRQLRESFIVRVNMLTVLILFCICFASVESYQRDRSQCHNADLQGQCNLCHRHEGCADVSGKTLAIQRDCGPKPNKGINRTQMNKKVRSRLSKLTKSENYCRVFTTISHLFCTNFLATSNIESMRTLNNAAVFDARLWHAHGTIFQVVPLPVKEVLGMGPVTYLQISEISYPIYLSFITVPYYYNSIHRNLCKYTIYYTE